VLVAELLVASFLSARAEELPGNNAVGRPELVIPVRGVDAGGPEVPFSKGVEWSQRKGSKNKNPAAKTKNNRTVRARFI
jgi:hypothetical protein